MGCTFCQAEIGKIGYIEGYAGSCPNCEIGKYPEKILVKLISSQDGIHTFESVGIARCKGCGVMVKEISVYCSEPIDVTEEFNLLKERKNG